MLIFMLILCLLTNSIIGKPQSSGSAKSCTTASNEDGFCIPIESCDYLNRLAIKPYLHRGELDVLQRSQCDRNQPSNVCCRQATVAKTTFPTQSLTSATHNTSPKSSEPRISARKCKEYEEFQYDKSYIKNTPGSLYVIKSENCAVVSKAVILGGTPVAKTEFPHMALIGYDTYKGNRKVTEWLCGGSLISEQFVVSAAHCLESKSSPKYVRLGEHDKSRTDEAASIDFSIIKIIPHPDYRSPYNDIMLLKLNRVVQFNGAIRPICLPEQSVVATEDAVVSGWGINSTDSDNQSDVLLKVTLEIFPHSTCEEKYAPYGGLPRGIVDDIQLCAGWMKGDMRKDACRGDSGGPIQTNKHKTGCIYTILGITSFGPTFGPDICGIRGHPSVYTRVYPYLDWIEKIVWPNE